MRCWNEGAVTGLLITRGFRAVYGRAAGTSRREAT
jgi:hypothetical protein